MPNHPVVIEELGGDGFSLRVLVTAEPERAFECLVSCRDRDRWWRPGVMLEPQVGGSFAEPWRGMDGCERTTRGEVLTVKPGVLLALSWAEDDWPVETQVELHFGAVGAGSSGCQVLLDHYGFAALASYDPDAIGSHLIGWRRHLRNLERYLRTGASARADEEYESDEH